MNKRFLLVVMAFASVIAGCGGGTEQAAQRAPVVVIGIDGAEWEVINELLAKGELPNIRQMLERGAYGPMINTGPESSPVVWTSFVTGHFGRQHGVLDHVYPYAGSRGKRPVTSELRLKPALWNIASEYGLKSVVVGYFVTQPPEEIDGVMVSPMAAYWQDNTIWPPDAVDVSSARYQELRDDQVAQSLARRYFNWEWELGQEDDASSPYHRAAQIVRTRHLDRRIVRDEFMRRAGRDLAASMRDDPADLFINYFRLVDFMSHSLWMFHDPAAYEIEPEPAMVEYFGEAIRESYRYMDEIIGEVMAEWQGRANIIVLSDHGFGPMGGEHDADTLELTGDHRPVGIMLAVGPDIAPGELQGMTVMEVMPTLAAMLGVPVADEWPGRVEAKLLREDYLEDFPLQTIPNYAHLQVNRREDAVAEEAVSEDMSSLRGLGYVGEGVDVDAGAAQGDFDFWAASNKLVLRSMMDEIVYALMNGDAAQAESLYRQFAEKRPVQAGRLMVSVRGKFSRIMKQVPPDSIDRSALDAFVQNMKEGASD